MNHSDLTARRPVDSRAAGIMIGLCLCWGLQQVAIKSAAPYMSSLLQVGVRSFFAALLVALLMLWRRDQLSLRDGTLKPGIFVALLFAGEFMAIAVGLQFTTAGHMAVFLYTAPVFAAVGLHWLVEGERLSGSRWWGVALAFTGVAVGYSGSLFIPGGKDMLLGDALGILAGILWAGTTVAIRRTSLSEAAPTKTLLYQLTGAGLLLPLFAIWRGDHLTVQMSWLVAGNLLFQTVVIAFGSYLLWFALLRKYLASRLSIFSLLTPLFGVAFGVILLKEPLDPRFVVGGLLVLGGIAIVNKKS